MERQRQEETETLGHRCREMNRQGDRDRVTEVSTDRKRRDKKQGEPE